MEFIIALKGRDLETHILVIYPKQTTTTKDVKTTDLISHT